MRTRFAGQEASDTVGELGGLDPDVIAAETAEYETERALLHQAELAWDARQVAEQLPPAAHSHRRLAGELHEVSAALVRTFAWRALRVLVGDAGTLQHDGRVVTTMKHLPPEHALRDAVAEALQRNDFGTRTGERALLREAVRTVWEDAYDLALAHEGRAFEVSKLEILRRCAHLAEWARQAGQPLTRWVPISVGVLTGLQTEAHRHEQSLPYATRRLVHACARQTLAAARSDVRRGEAPNAHLTAPAAHCQEVA